MSILQKMMPTDDVSVKDASVIEVDVLAGLFLVEYSTDVAGDDCRRDIGSSDTVELPFNVSEDGVVEDKDSSVFVKVDELEELFLVEFPTGVAGDECRKVIGLSDTVELPFNVSEDGIVEDKDSSVFVKVDELEELFLVELPFSIAEVKDASMVVNVTDLEALFLIEFPTAAVDNSGLVISSLVTGEVDVREELCFIELPFDVVGDSVVGNNTGDNDSLEVVKRVVVS